MKNLLFLALTVFAFACNSNNRNTNNESDSLENQNELSNRYNKENQDSAEEFVTTAASSGMMEVQLGEMAMEKASSQEVKNFGQMMVKDHSQANNQLKAIATDLNIKVPSEMKEEHQQKIDRMQNVPTEDFDRKYMDVMVQAHEKDVEKFEQTQNQVEQPELQSWIIQTLPILQNHLQQAEQINQQMGGTALK